MDLLLCTITFIFEPVYSFVNRFLCAATTADEWRCVAAIYNAEIKLQTQRELA
ncbi:hypothetical protein R0381_002982 [Jeongeupia wiesaeckerbachi]|uniref:hypothetical protein n=1 Tax=Jeongeupia wiesaeckerbachi TaxID=3051218 RepID=UPI003D801C17